MYRRGRLTGDYKSKRGYAGLGSANAISLAAARVAGQKCREWLADGQDPRQELLREKREAATALANSTATFLDMANDWITARANDAEKPWRGNTRQGHEQRLNFHLKPLHTLPVTEVTANHIYAIIHPLRQAGHKSTAHKVRMLAENIIEWAQARDAFPIDKMNPASMKGPLRILLKTTDTQPISTPLPSVHYTKLPALYAKISALTERPWLTMSEAARVSGSKVTAMFTSRASTPVTRPAMYRCDNYSTPGAIIACAASCLRRSLRSAVLPSHELRKEN
jgi:hypothetical protein